MTKLPLEATRMNLSEKVRSLFGSAVFQKVLMFCCLLSLLLVSGLVTYYSQSPASLNSEQEQSQAEPNAGNSALTPKDIEDIEGEVEKGRALMLTLESLASDELSKVLNAYFKPNRLLHPPKVSGSVHYDLLDTRDYSNPKLINWFEGDGAGELVQSSDFPFETHIKLKFSDDEQLNSLSVKDVQGLFKQICQSGVAEIGQRASLLFVGPESERMFACPSACWDSPQIEEIKFD